MLRSVRATRAVWARPCGGARLYPAAVQSGRLFHSRVLRGQPAPQWRCRPLEQCSVGWRPLCRDWAPAAWPARVEVARPFSSSSGGPEPDPDSEDPYQRLGVYRGCSDSELKHAYLRAAKAYHPDMNPGDETAKKRFQRISEAYELLKNRQNRAQYDSSGQWTKQGGEGPTWESTWRDFVKDREVVVEVVQLYMETVREEGMLAVELAWKGRWTEAWSVAREHKVLLMAIGGLLVVLRFPAVLGVAMRIVVLALSSLGTSRNLQQVRLERLMLWAWSHLVSAAHGQRARLRQRASEREATAARARAEEARRSREESARHSGGSSSGARLRR